MKITCDFAPSVTTLEFIVAWRCFHQSSGRGAGSTAE
jgi:hypothetical protein